MRGTRGSGSRTLGASAPLRKILPSPVLWQSGELHRQARRDHLDPRSTKSRLVAGLRRTGAGDGHSPTQLQLRYQRRLRRAHARRMSAAAGLRDRPGTRGPLEVFTRSALAAGRPGSQHYGGGTLVGGGAVGEAAGKTK